MRIAIVAPPWLPVPPPAYGGTEAVLDGLARGLVAAGHEVLLIGHPDSTCPVPKASVVAAADTVPMGRAITELEHAIGAYALAEGYDVVSDHTIGGPIVALSVPAPRRSWRPTTTRSVTDVKPCTARLPRESPWSPSRTRTHPRPTFRSRP